MRINQSGGANPKKIFEKYKAKLIDRLRNDRTAKINIDNLTTLPWEIINADPTGNKQYIEWITNSYILGGISLYEDLSRTHSALVKYEHLRNSGKLEKNPDVKKDENIIANFCGLKGCYKKNRKLMGLDDLIDKYKDEFEEKELKEEEKRKAQKEGISVYDGKTIRVIRPTTEAAACYYGRGTRWCTATTESENMFEEYNSRGHLYIIIPKNPAYEGEKYQIHFDHIYFEEDQYMNEKNEAIDLEKLAEEYPELSKVNLNFAVKLNSVDDVRKLLEKDVNVDNNALSYALRIASEKGYLKIVKLLLENGANVNDQYALLTAIKNNYLEITKLLIENGADVNANNGAALAGASQRGHLEIVKLLLSPTVGADVNASKALAVASDLEIVKFLIENGADVNANNGVALDYASRNGNLEIVKFLLENGADVNANNGAALAGASQRGHLEIVKLLLSPTVGADVNADNGRALSFAISADKQNIVHFLLENGANLYDEALTTAIRFNKPKYVQLLIDYGADFSKISKTTPNYGIYAKIYNKEYFKREEKEGNLADWEDICRYLNQEYRLPQLKSIANKLAIKYDNNVTKKDLCELISKDYDAWVKEENKDKDNIRMEIHKKKSIK
jgi:ankyrin repeat protein